MTANLMGKLLGRIPEVRTHGVDPLNQVCSKPLPHPTTPIELSQRQMDVSDDQSHHTTMKVIPAGKFKEQCLALLDDVDPEGIVITKRGKPVARLVPIERAGKPLIGRLKGKIQVKGTCSRPAFAGRPMLNLDTHVLLHALAGELKPRERKVLESEPWDISAIVLSELAKLIQLGTVEMDLDGPDFERVIAFGGSTWL